MKYPKQQTLEEISGMFSVFGMEPYEGEDLSQFQHAAQTAQLAEKEGYDEEVQIAAFLHDVGHMLPVDYESELMVVFRRKNHEKAASDWLMMRGFSEKVGVLVANHVRAKRYMMYKNPLYQSLVLQEAGPVFYGEVLAMNEVEADAFEKFPYFDLIIQMRKWDDAARVPGAETPNLDHYISMIKRYLEKRFPVL